MELWIGHAKKLSTCHYCDDGIMHGTPLIQGRVKKRKGHPWPPVLRWHPECWFKASLEVLARKQPERVVMAKSLGRPKLVDTTTGLNLDAEARQSRYLLVRRFNTLLYRRNKIESLLIGADELNLDLLGRYRDITKKLRTCAVEAESTGGAPKSWACKLLDGGMEDDGKGQAKESEEGYPPGSEEPASGYQQEEADDS